MVLIIYDSIYGNTLKIAEAIRDLALRLRHQAVLVHAGLLRQEQLYDANLVFLGSPTRAFRPTPILKRAIGLWKSEWRGKAFMAFDTRMDMNTVESKFLKTMVRWFGYAADHVAKRLKRWGAIELGTPVGFCVQTTIGPLIEGEIHRLETVFRRFLEVTKNEL